MDMGMQAHAKEEDEGEYSGTVRTDTDIKPFQEALTCEVNSALLTYDNHNANTIFLDPSYRVMERMLREYHFGPVGICKNVPYNRHRANQIAFVYRYEDELFWCHLPEICWMSFLMEISERGKADF